MTINHIINEKTSQKSTSAHVSPLTPVEVSTQKITRRYIRGAHPARVTRISIESRESNNHQEIKPRLKRGVYLSTPGNDEKCPLVIKSAQQAIVIHHLGARAIVAQLDGYKTISDISSEIGAPVEIVQKVIEQLLLAQMLDTKTSKIKLHNRFQSPIAERAAHTEDQSNDASYKQLQVRMNPELNQTTWIYGVVDGGVELLSSRQNFGVEIYGENRLATLIYTGLLASGVTNSKFSIRSRKYVQTIGDSDLGTGILRNNDFGLNFKVRVEELSREWSLFPTASKDVKGTISTPIPERNLRVVVGEYSIDVIDLLMRDKQDHLFVGQVMGSAASVGPLVIPGKSPCAWCLESAKNERFGVEGFISTHNEQLEIPVALTFQLAGAAVQSILQWIDTGKSDLIGAQSNFNYLTPIRPETTSISRHPNCRCQWSELTNSKKSTSKLQPLSATQSAETIPF